jgi:hypothetical protein
MRILVIKSKGGHGHARIDECLMAHYQGATASGNGIFGGGYTGDMTFTVD